MDRGRREKVIRKMLTEDDCHPFTDLNVNVRADRRKVVKFTSKFIVGY